MRNVTLDHKNIIYETTCKVSFFGHVPKQQQLLQFHVNVEF